MANESKEFKTIACNYLEGTSICAQGAIAYPLLTGVGEGDGSRILILARSRGGRFVRKREALRNLHNFRVKTIVPENNIWHLMHGDGTYLDADWWNEQAETFRQEYAERKAAREQMVAVHSG